MELGRNVIRPAISGLMGAFGAALYAKEKVKQNVIKKTTLISQEELETFSYASKNSQCRGCTGNCSINIITFNGGRKFISGNRCEKGAGLKKNDENLDLYDYKYKKLLEIVSEKPKNPVAKVGLPLVLHYYEQLPLWHRFFTDLSFEVIISEESTRNTYFKGQHTIPSDTVCYPAKLAHGHIESLLEKGVDFIFYPCASYNIDEEISDNHYNCPVVAYYPELLKANNLRLNDNNFIHPYLDLNRKNHVVNVMKNVLTRYNVNKKDIENALESGFKARDDYYQGVVAEGQRIINEAREKGKKIIVLAGRPYHIDPEINHGIHKLITSLGMAVVTEDSISHLGKVPKLHVLNQWTYHARLYKAAQYVLTQLDMQLVQLVSFGCGIDAITSDEVRSILEGAGKLYTQLKIDEISNLGAAKIRLRSLIAAME